MGLVTVTVTEPKTFEKVVGAVCDNCGAKWEGELHWSTIPGGLWVSVDGGYGMFIDNDAPIRLLFCNPCAQSLMDAFPVIIKKWHEQFP